MNKKDIINFDTQGWPLSQLNIRAIIEKICTYDADTQRYYINADDKILDLVPRVFEDDGMGYGVNEKRVVSFDIFSDSKDTYSNIFIEEPIKDIDIWLEGKFYPHCFVKKGKKRYVARGIRRNEDGTFEYECEGFSSRNGGDGNYTWISEDKLDFD